MPICRANRSASVRSSGCVRDAWNGANAALYASEGERGFPFSCARLRPHISASRRCTKIDLRFRIVSLRQRVKGDLRLPCLILVRKTLNGFRPFFENYTPRRARTLKSAVLSLDDNKQV